MEETPQTPLAGQNKREALKARALRELAHSTLLDDVYMTAFFDGFPEGVELVLRIILGKDDLTVLESKVQYVITNPGGHDVRLDVFAEDSDHKLYNIEFQNAPADAVPQRARYYSALLDTRALGKKQGYTELCESCVIFVTATDIFRRGKALYRFERVDAENGEPFGDGALIYYLNTARADAEGELGKLIHDITCAEVPKMVYPILRKRAEKIKRTNDIGGARMGGLLEEAWEGGKREGLLEGRQEGLLEGATQIIRAMLRRNMELPDIADIAGVSVEDVLAIQSSLAAG